MIFLLVFCLFCKSLVASCICDIFFNINIDRYFHLLVVLFFKYVMVFIHFVEFRWMWFKVQILHFYVVGQNCRGRPFSVQVIHLVMRISIDNYYYYYCYFFLLFVVWCAQNRVLITFIILQLWKYSNHCTHKIMKIQCKQKTKYLCKLCIL